MAPPGRPARLAGGGAQRWSGSSLNAHFHYHVVILDGLFSESEDGRARFHEASERAPRHWEELQRTVQRRILRYFRRHDLLDEFTIAEMLTWQGTGGFSFGPT